jgi:hypothetical protein
VKSNNASESTPTFYEQQATTVVGAPRIPPQHADLPPTSSTPNSSQPESSSPHNPRIQVPTPGIQCPAPPAYSAPKDFNHPHQEERPIERATDQRTNQPGHILQKASKPDVSAFFPDDDDVGKHHRKPLNDPEQEFRTRLQERHWFNERVEIEGIVVIVREKLGNNYAKFKRFLEYEAALTNTQKIKNPGGHYRVLVKEFCDSESNTRIEKERKTGSDRKNESWHCELNQCSRGIIEDENGIPFPDLYTCPSTQALSQDRRANILAAITGLRVLAGLPTPHGDTRHHASGSQVA